MRAKLADAYNLIEDLDGGVIDPQADEAWFEIVTAFAVCTPAGIALLMAMGENLYPACCG